MTEQEYLKKYLHPKDNLDNALERLAAGEPVQYIVGDVEFYHCLIKVNKSVLIPRPETEELVEKTSYYIKKYFPSFIKILDIGTGSGCIAIALKKLFPNNILTATDISQDALNVAITNAKLNNTQITFLKSDIYSNIKGKYSCIISNPPYIKENEEIMDIVKNNEPSIALYAPHDGLYYYEQILKSASQYLEDKFLIAFEIGETQGSKIISQAHNYFPTSKIWLEKDLRGFDRFVFIMHK